MLRKALRLVMKIGEAERSYGVERIAWFVRRQSVEGRGGLDRR